MVKRQKNITNKNREPKLGHYSMMVGILMLLFIGFNRTWHFVYIRLDDMLCGIFNLSGLPAASTFWRYVDNLGINQTQSLLKVMSTLRENVWQLCDLPYVQIRINIDTTVKTVYGNQQGARKGHNTKHRGKQGLRPILCFIEETREYFLVKLRNGTTVTGKEAADFIAAISDQLLNTVIEALSCVTPCVGFNIGGIPEMIEHKKNGYIAAKLDTNDLSNGIMWVLKDAERWKFLSGTARKTAEREYDISIIAKRYTELYQTILT